MMPQPHSSNRAPNVLRGAVRDRADHIWDFHVRLGPGLKTYVLTLYALSAYPRWPVSAEKLDRPALLAAIEGLVLGRAELRVVYERTPEKNPNREPIKKTY